MEYSRDPLVAFLGKESAMSSGTITEGPKTRTPKLPTGLVTSLARDLYGLHVHTSTELDSFLDRNYHVKVDAATPVCNKFIGEGCPHGYVLKVFNSVDSRNTAYVGTEVALLQYVYGRGLRTPRPVPTTDGQPFVLCTFNLQDHQQSYEKLGDPSSSEKASEVEGEKTTHAVRLVEYLPGHSLASVPLTAALCRQVGRQAAQLDILMQGFEETTPDVPVGQYSWKLENVTSLRPLLDVIKDTTLRAQISDVIDGFEARLSQSDIANDFKRGYIHSDYNTFNVLVSKLSQENSSPMPSSPGSESSTSMPFDRTDHFSPSLSSSSSSYSSSSLSSSSPPTSSSSEEWTVSGILDFGDFARTCVFLEPAIAMSHVMLECPEEMEPEELAGQVLSGYLSQVTLSRQEIQLLPLAIRARFSQHLVLALHTLQRDPHNDYVSSMMAPIQRHFSRFYQMPDDVIISLWTDIAKR